MLSSILTLTILYSNFQQRNKTNAINHNIWIHFLCIDFVASEKICQEFFKQEFSKNLYRIMRFHHLYSPHFHINKGKVLESANLER
jgi:hypothetical protein